MDCEICFHEFEEDKCVPKVLRQCGHTFCESCVIKLWKNNKIVCPICRKTKYVFD